MPSEYAEAILEENCQPFCAEIAKQARLHGRYERAYGLGKVVDGFLSGTPSLTVYGYHDSCIIVGDDFEAVAYDVNQFDVHEVVRMLMDRTAYVLTYVERDRLSVSQARTVGLEVDDDAE